MNDTEVAGSLEIEGTSKENGHQVISMIKARFQIAGDVADVHFPILAVGDNLTRATFRAKVIGRDRTEARDWIETLCRDALRPFDGANPPFTAVVKLEVDAPA